MFNGANAFNGDLSSWAVSSVTDMQMMFRHANAFNSDLSAWSVGKVTSCSGFCRGGAENICGVPTFTTCNSGCNDYCGGCSNSICMQRYR
jgi:surface protein